MSNKPCPNCQEHMIYDASMDRFRCRSCGVVVSGIVMGDLRGPPRTWVDDFSDAMANAERAKTRRGWRP